MTDGFDKEAEREKLREKFAKDDEKREHTQRMSELLLKGATMTNRHCDDCGDPIFRQDGREFCPTCHTVDAADVEQDRESTADAESVADVESAVRGEAAKGGTTAGDGDSVEGPATPQRDGPAPAAESRAGENGAGRVAHTDRSPAANAGADDPAESDAIGDARESLTRTLSRFARAAEQTDDPRRARDHLRAAREAAETLSALDR